MAIRHLSVTTKNTVVSAQVRRRTYEHDKHI